MTDVLSTKDLAWSRSRYGFVAFFLASLLVAWFALRVVLLVRFGLDGDVPALRIVQSLFVGFYRDFAAALVFSLPLLFWLWIVPFRTFGKGWHRAAFIGGFFLFWMTQMFLLFAEYFFFDEFESRFNTVAVDYLIYPHEVFINIWDSYPVPLVLLVCGGLSLAWTVFAFRRFRPMWQQPTVARSRFLHLAGAVVGCAVLLPLVNLKGTRFSKDRTLNEIADNGSIAFVAAAWTRHLDYAAFYQTLPRDEAYQRARRLLQEQGSEFLEDGHSIRRRIAGDPSKPRLNVVIILEESLGSKFWGSLGRPNTLTPEMDRLATEEGLLFTNIYASGNRTVRGFEGVLSSFPPLPGDSIVKRDLTENVESIARVLKRDGYSTVFLYGGRGLFDGMRSYAVRNGWDRFIEQKHFDDPVFTTIWGVSDEDLMGRAIAEFRELSKSGEPFFGTVLTVSNHKPFTYPRGRIPEDPERPRPTRQKAVKYSDWCLGKFFRDARQEAFWTNTVFVVVADHGARVYGSQTIPIESYEIPFVILGPAVVREPARIPHLGGSLDVAPTVLGLIGRPYDTVFFGRDLLKGASDDGRAFLNHNRDIGMMADNRMVVLGLMQTEQFYEGDPKVEMKLCEEPTAVDRELQKDAIAIYQVADELYTQRRFRIDVTPDHGPAPAEQATQALAQPIHAP